MTMNSVQMMTDMIISFPWWSQQEDLSSSISNSGSAKHSVPWL